MNTKTIKPKSKKTGRPVVTDSIRSQILEVVTKAGNKGLSHKEILEALKGQCTSLSVRVLLNTLKTMKLVENVPVKWRVIK